VPFEQSAVVIETYRQDAKSSFLASAESTLKMAASKAAKKMFLARPTVSPHSLQSQSPLTASIEPVVLFSILDHALRRNVNQKRVIGTMLGIRSDDGTEVEIRNCFAVPHNESNEQVDISALSCANG
jgi:hypothetical protein